MKPYHDTNITSQQHGYAQINVLNTVPTQWSGIENGGVLEPKTLKTWTMNINMHPISN
jgi:hypothetical protein